MGGAKNLYKAQKFAQKSLRLNETQEVKELLDRINSIKEDPIIEHPINIKQIDDAQKNEQSEEENDMPTNMDMAKIKEKEIKETPPREMQVNDELINQLIEQSMALQQQNKRLEKENKSLKQQLSVSQDINYERKKDEMKGTIYECNVVKVCQAMKRNDIVIRDGVQVSQNTSNQKMSGHEQRLNEWNKHTLHL